VPKNHRSRIATIGLAAAGVGIGTVFVALISAVGGF
jgi:hypothetical protein